MRCYLLLIALLGLAALCGCASSDNQAEDAGSGIGPTSAAADERSEAEQDDSAARCFGVSTAQVNQLLKADLTLADAGCVWGTDDGSRSVEVMGLTPPSDFDLPPEDPEGSVNQEYNGNYDVSVSLDKGAKRVNIFVISPDRDVAQMAAQALLQTVRAA